MQVKLLRAIQESEFERVGGLKTIKVDVRLITATNRDLEQEIAARQLPRGPVLPAQRRAAAASRRCASARATSRCSSQHIIKKFNERLKKTSPASPTTRSPRSRRHSWPGNIRELENVLERTILFCKGDRIERATSSSRRRRREHAAVPPATCSRRAVPVDRGRRGRARRASRGSLKEVVRAETARVERELIVKALDETGGNVTQAARLLKISRKSLQMKMKEFGLRDREG